MRKEIVVNVISITSSFLDEHEDEDVLEPLLCSLLESLLGLTDSLGNLNTPLNYLKSTLPLVKIKVYLKSRNKLQLLARGGNKGLTSLYLHCLGIEAMPVHPRLGLTLKAYV